MIYRVEYKRGGMLCPWVWLGTYRRYKHVREAIVGVRALYPGCEYRVTATP